MRFKPLVFSFLVGVLLLAGTGPAQAAPLARDPAFNAWLVTPAPQPLCPGDRVAISVMAMETTHNVPATAYPMNIIQSNPQIGHLDPVSKVVINGMADFIYIANDGADNGTQTDVLKFNIGGFPTGLSVPITVYGACDYRLNLLMEQHIQEEMFTIDTVISGELTLRRATGQAHGEGADDVYAAIGDTGGVIKCNLTPPIQGSSTFQADSTFNPVSPGVENMSFDLIFDRVPLNSAMLHCYDDLPNDMNIEANVPFEMTQWDPDELGLQELMVVLNNGSGSVPVSYKEMRGQVTIRREVRQ
ncbi:MAG TPA: hypothetical protein VHO48_09155 [Anaerolineaceae bacterium]|nr:hypothetical protein [Anaerolineaceae bacterium]